MDARLKTFAVRSVAGIGALAAGIAGKAYADTPAFLPGLGNLGTSPITSNTSANSGHNLSLLANRIVDILLAIAFPLAFAAIVYSSYLLITSAGKPEAVQAARKNLTYLVTGIVVIVFGLFVVRFIITLFQ